MKILLISDVEEPALWDYYRPGRLAEYDMILSAGDLKAEYLSFLVTMANVPVLYVHGNHNTSYDRFPPEGCDCVEDKLVTYKGLRILGLGGSAVYSGGNHQYTERQMARRIRRLNRAVRKAGGVDIVLTHCPPKG
ncbi:MAG: metallophosphoesterase, partial [Clostridia bacterium]|nr:metallophosphoesterase [Clostridia bacterium]